MFTPVVQWLIIANVVMFFGEPYLPRAWAGYMALWPVGTFFEPWQLVTYAFLHGSLDHLFFNMLGLFVFGNDLERVWGGRRLLNCYLLSVITAGITQLIFAASTGAQEPTVGASGGVFGLLLAFAMVFPNRRLMLIFPPIPMSSRTLAIGYGAIELALGVTGTQAGVAHFAHLGGMLGAWLYLSF
ncbi:MAG: rhomboid family intramembrane serine protease [Hyphomicrobiales bacterium]